MGHATFHYDDAVTAASTPKSVRRHAAHPSVYATPHAYLPPSDFEAFAAVILRDLSPRSAIERVLVDRLTVAAWRLHLLSTGEKNVVCGGDDLPPVSRDALRAERSLEIALDLLATARAAASPRWGKAVHTPSKVEFTGTDGEDVADDDEEALFSNEWPVVPAAEYFDDEPADDVATEPEADDVSVRWQDRLVFDESVSDTSPVVRGTWVTAGHVVSLVVDGWSWSDVLRAHPELTEDDVRTCLAYTVEQDDAGEY